MHLTYISATIAVAIALLSAWYCRRLAQERGRGITRWTLAGFVLTIVALPVLYLLPATPADSVEGPAPDAG